MLMRRHVCVPTGAKIPLSCNGLGKRRKGPLFVGRVSFSKRAGARSRIRPSRRAVSAFPVRTRRLEAYRVLLGHILMAVSRPVISVRCPARFDIGSSRAIYCCYKPRPLVNAPTVR